MLFFGEAQRRAGRDRAARIIDTHAATHRKDGGKSLVRELTRD